MKNLTIVRGLPGSGKSYLARLLTMCSPRSLRHGVQAVQFEADQFMFVDGVYAFDASRLHMAHTKCYDKADEYLSLNYHVYVSNTFTTKKELKPYFELALKYGIIPTVICTQSSFGSIHNVPEDVMVKMKARFCHDISELFKVYS